MRCELNNMIVKNYSELLSYAKVKLWKSKSGLESEEFLNECFLYLCENISSNKRETDYLKLAKRWIHNQTYWSSKSKLPKSSGKNIKSKLKNIGGGGDMTAYESHHYEDEVDLDWKIEYGMWIETKLDKPEKILLRLYFIEENSIKKISDLIRSSGIQISDSSIYLSIQKLKSKLKYLGEEWKKL